MGDVGSSLLTQQQHGLSKSLSETAFPICKRSIIDFVPAQGHWEVGIKEKACRTLGTEVCLKEAVAAGIGLPTFSHGFLACDMRNTVESSLGFLNAENIDTSYYVGKIYPTFVNRWNRDSPKMCMFQSLEPVDA